MKCGCDRRESNFLCDQVMSSPSPCSTKKSSYIILYDALGSTACLVSKKKQGSREHWMQLEPLRQEEKRLQQKQESGNTID